MGDPTWMTAEEFDAWLGPDPEPDEPDYCWTDEWIDAQWDDIRYDLDLWRRGEPVAAEHVNCIKAECDICDELRRRGEL